MDQQRRLAKLLTKIPSWMRTSRTNPVGAIETLLGEYLKGQEELAQLRKKRTLLLPKKSVEIFRTLNWPKIIEALEMVSMLEDVPWESVNETFAKFGEQFSPHFEFEVKSSAEQAVFELVEDALVVSSNALKEYDPEARIVMLTALRGTPLILAMAKRGFFEEGDKNNAKI